MRFAKNITSSICNLSLGRFLDTIIKYLQNPMKIGIYNHKVVVDLSVIVEHLETLLNKEKKTFKKTKKQTVSKLLGDFHAKRISRLDEAFDELKNETFVFEDSFETLSKAFRVFAGLDEFPETLVDVFYLRKETKLPSGRIVKRRVAKSGRIPDVFGSCILQELKDVLSVERKRVGKRKWLFDVVAIKEVGIEEFKNHLDCIPRVEETKQILKERRQFSTRYTFRPYPLAVKLWLQDDASIAVPSDLKSFLQAASNYFFSAEWRTSIVLSAISVESVLADLYEETKKEPAPDVPLGDLFRQVKEKIGFPADIVKAIEVTNESRISAVHRSRFPVSDKEATNALHGSTNVILWYVSNY